MKNLILLMVLLFACITVTAQEAPREVVYQHTDLGNGKYQFKIIKDPEGSNIVGKPPASFEYYWEFGDGTYLVTTDKTITHTYAATGEKDVLLKTTGVYDDGKPPIGKMANTQKPNVQLISAPIRKNMPSPIAPGERFELDLNRSSESVIPDEESVFIIKYKNDGKLRRFGRIYLFFNEKQTRKSSNYIQQFDIKGAPRIYSEGKSVGEQRLQSGRTNDTNSRGLLPAGASRVTRNTFANIWNDFESYEAFSFSNLPPNEESNIFLTLQSDTNIGDIEGKYVKIKALLISGNQVDTTSVDLTVAKAHDPNKISVSEVRESFRRVENRFLTYRVQFQNDGEAEAQNVEVTVEIPKGLEVEKVKFLPNKFKMKHFKNKILNDCTKGKGRPCYNIDIQEDVIVFSFNKVYLPGLKQTDVKKYKQTTGSFEYKIKYRKKLKKEPLKSRAHIVFKDDFGKRKPVTTSYTTTRFKPGLSLGPKAGVSWDVEYQQPTYFAGVVASPYKSDRFYLQVEGLVSYGQFSCDYEPGSTPDCKLLGTQIDSMGLSEVPVFDLDTLIRTETSEYHVEGSNLALHIPVQIRRDLNKFISIGLGAELGVEFRRSTFLQNMEIQQIEHFWDVGWIPFGDPDVSLVGEITEQNSTHFTSSVFADVLIGSVKAGPAVGVRYLRGVIVPKVQGDFGEITLGKDRLQAFAQWKF